MKRMIAFLAVMAYVLAITICVVRPELFDLGFMFFFSCGIALIVLLATAKKKEKNMSENKQKKLRSSPLRKGKLSCFFLMCRSFQYGS
jgi:hypothetical protein